MRELNVNEIQEVNGAVAITPLILTTLTVIAAIDTVIDAYNGYQAGVERAKQEAIGGS